MSKGLTLPYNYEYDTDKLEVGDLINITFKYVNPKKSADNALAKVIDRSDKWVLVAIDGFNGGHHFGGHECKGNCWYVSSFTDGLFTELKWIKLNDELFFDEIFNYINENVDYLNKPKGLINEGYQIIPYDVISSLYESEDLDWAINMASDISKKIITPGQYYRINGKIAIAITPFDDTIDLYIKEVNDDVVIYDIISEGRVGGSNWSAKVNLKLASKFVNDKYWYLISKEESLFNKKRMDESEDFDWAMDIVNTVNLNMASIPTKDDYKNYVILFDKPGITIETIEEIVNYIQKNTEWYFTDSNQSIYEIFEDYREGNRSPYIRLFPGPELNVGDSEETFNAVTDLNFNHPQVNIIRPYSYDETINESEDGLDWAMDMAKDIEKNLTNLSMIPTKVNGYYNVILFDKPGITMETIEEIVNYIQKYTEWKFDEAFNAANRAFNAANRIYACYEKDYNLETYINLKPDGTVTYGYGHDVFRNVNKVSFNSPQVKIIRPY
jgi:hypothetical protein